MKQGEILRLTVPERILVVREDIKIMHKTFQRDFLFYLLCGVLHAKAHKLKARFPAHPTVGSIGTLGVGASARKLVRWQVLLHPCLSASPCNAFEQEGPLCDPLRSHRLKSAETSKY